MPQLNFLLIDGKGDPNISRDFQDAIATLYSVAFTLKFMVKKGPAAIDYVVPPLEGLWWTDDMAQFSVSAKSDWSWTVMIMQPDFITRELFNAALTEVNKKKDPPALAKLRLEPFNEGTAVQILHIGPVANEAPTIAKLHDFIHAHGWSLRDRHHEIYLSDPQRVPPEKLKTIIRQPIQTN